MENLPPPGSLNNTGNAAAEPPQAEHLFANTFDTSAYEKNMKNARTWLYVVAGIQLIAGIYEYFTIADQDKTVAVTAFGIDAFIGIVFVVLALWSRKKPVAAFTTAIVIYILIAVGLMLIDPSNIWRGVIIKILVMIALVKANRDARKYTELKESLGENL